MPSTPDPEGQELAAQPQEKVLPESWITLRHDVRNLLNAIKLTCAVLHRRPGQDDFAKGSLREIEQAADNINVLISRFTDDHPLPSNNH